MSQNTMMLFRGKDNDRRDAIEYGITPFIPRAHREHLHWGMYLRCAAHQLEGKEFSPETLLPALLTFALAGILPNKFNHFGYLIPYRSNKKKKIIVTPVFGYQGLIHLAYQARSANGAVLLDVQTDYIAGSDEYDKTSKPEEMVRTHRPLGARNPTIKPEDFRLAYARFKYAIPIGSAVHEYERIQVATSGEIANVDSGKNVWKSHWARMATKTAIRRACASGRVELAYLAGMALGAEGQAQSDPGQYMQAIESAAIDHGLPPNTMEMLAGAQEAVVDSWSVDDYLLAATPIHVAMGEATCSLEKARQLAERLGDLRNEMGAPENHIDEIAAQRLETIQAEYDKNA